MSEDMFGNLKPGEKVVDQSQHTDTEGGGYRFLMYGGGRRRQPKESKDEKVFSPGKPVEVNLSAAAISASRTAVPEGGDAKKEASPSPQPGQKQADEATSSPQDGDTAVKHINITL